MQPSVQISALELSMISRKSLNQFKATQKCIIFLQIIFFMLVLESIQL